MHTPEDISRALGGVLDAYTERDPNADMPETLTEAIASYVTSAIRDRDKQLRIERRRRDRGKMNGVEMRDKLYEVLAEISRANVRIEEARQRITSAQRDAENAQARLAILLQGARVVGFTGAGATGGTDESR